MPNYLVSDTDLTAVANAIREKGGTSATLEFPSGFISAIQAISGGGLPPEYQEVEYLQSTGTQYIDTGLTGNIDKEWVIEFSDFDRNGVSYAGPFGNYASGAIVGIYCGNQVRVYASFGNVEDLYYNTSSASATEWAESTRRKIAISRNGVYENDVQKIPAFSNLSYTSSDSTIVLFARRGSNGIVGNNIKAKIYNFMCIESGATIAHFIPCYRKSDDEPGMYDIVRNQFYTNSGTGTFLLPSA